MERIKKIFKDMEEFITKNLYIAICIIFISFVFGFFFGEIYYDGVVNQYAVFSCYVKMTNESFNISINKSIPLMQKEMREYKDTPIINLSK